MARAPGLAVTVSSATTSDHVQLPQGGDYVLALSSAGNFAVDIQEGGNDGLSFADMYYDETNKVTLGHAGPRSVRVPGGQCYRMNATTYNNPITMTATRVGC